MLESDPHIIGNDHGSPLWPVRRSTKHIFVTGGVASSLGKGLTASSLGNLLKARGLRVTMQKLDPYLNVDPGTMNPFQHGEVFVTDDGAETDLDIGHYERFLDRELAGSANVTTGQVYSAVIAKERRGEYLGDTVQVIPHITNEIKARIRRMAGTDVDVVITEVGGTVGDIESLPFLEAVRQVRHEVGRDSTFVVHVSLLPYIGPSGELKTKPTQHSVAALRNIGIQPDAIVLRADRPVPTSIKRKVGLMCDVDDEAVVAAVDAPSIYDIPKVLHSEGLDAYVVRRLGLPFRDVDWTEWDDLLRRVHQPGARGHRRPGRQVHRPARRLPVGDRGAARGWLRQRRAGHHAMGHVRRLRDHRRRRSSAQRRRRRLCSRRVRRPRHRGQARGAALCPRAPDPDARACASGLQCMVIEYARNVAGLVDANSMEFDDSTPHPVIATMADQRDVVAGERDMGGTMRLGLYPAKLVEGIDRPRDLRRAVRRGASPTPVRGEQRVPRPARGRPGFVISGTSPDGRLVEFVELPREVHPYYVATQAHPEFRSRPTRAHPLFAGLVAAALAAQARAGRAARGRGGRRGRERTGRG